MGEDTTERVRTALKYMDAIGPESAQFASGFQRDLSVVKAGVDQDGYVFATFKLKTEEWMQNNLGIVHGGAMSTAIDLITSIAVIADPKAWPAMDDKPETVFAAMSHLGVSRNLSIQFMQATLLEQEIFFFCKVLSNTKRNSFITVNVTDAKGRLLVSGTHDKVKLTNKAPKL